MTKLLAIVAIVSLALAQSLPAKAAARKATAPPCTVASATQQDGQPVGSTYGPDGKSTLDLAKTVKVVVRGGHSAYMTFWSHQRFAESETAMVISDASYAGKEKRKSDNGRDYKLYELKASSGKPQTIFVSSWSNAKGQDPGVWGQLPVVAERYPHVSEHMWVLGGYTSTTGYENSDFAAILLCK